MTLVILPRRPVPRYMVFNSRRFLSSTKSSAAASREPLRILFCGSDEFSCTSLRALHREYVRNRQLIESLDVMVLPPRWAGRGNKELREVPAKRLAEELQLSIHQRSTFREWQPPEGTNLIVAVSFGLFVPSRILQSLKYGGLNVHPSLLPDLRGPAPLHHALLNGDTFTGVSLQTLDSKAFDHGTVLAQTPPSSFPIEEDVTLSKLTTRLADEGAEMLVQGLSNGLYLPPYQDVSSKVEGELRHAPKLTKEEARIDWQAGDFVGGEILARRLKGVLQVFGTAWTEMVDTQGKAVRVILKEVETVRREHGQGKQKVVVKLANGGERSLEVTRHGQGILDVFWGDGVWVRVKRVVVAGGKEMDGEVLMKRFGMANEA